MTHIYNQLLRGFHEAFTIVDSQKYLVRQRRTRTWGCVSVDTGTRKQEDYETDFNRVLHSLSSDYRFSVEDSFKKNQCLVDLTGRVKDLVDGCIEKYQVFWQPKPWSVYCV